MFRIRLIRTLLNLRSVGFDQHFARSVNRRQISFAFPKQQKLANFSKIILESKPNRLMVGSAVGLAGVGLVLCSSAQWGADAEFREKKEK